MVAKTSWFVGAFVRMATLRNRARFVRMVCHVNKVTDAYIRRLNAICAAIDCDGECLHIGYCARVYNEERAMHESNRRDIHGGIPSAAAACDSVSL